MVKNTKKFDTGIENLVKSFFKGSLPNQVECIKDMTWNAQQKFLDQTIYSPLHKKYPGSHNFNRLFFKKLIEYLELEQEVHDDIYGYLCSVMEKDPEDNFCYCHYLIDNTLNNIVSIKETKNLVLNGTTGLRTWEAALMLSDWSICYKNIYLNKTVLELGSGVGLTGITIAKNCNPKSMVMTDCHVQVLETINNNVRINFPGLKVEQGKTTDSSVYTHEEKTIGVMKLDWNDIENQPQNFVPDIIIGADIVYDPTILNSLLRVLIFYQNINNNVDIYIASVIRNADTFNGFLNALGQAGFSHTTLELTKNVHLEWDVNLERCLLKINKR